jgi:hypothetical protein
MTVERLYYALSDGFTGDNPENHTAGFANRKEVIAFRDHQDRAKWVRETKLTTAKILTRAEATRITDYDTYVTDADAHIKSCRIYGEDEFAILHRMDRKTHTYLKK